MAVESDFFHTSLFCLLKLWVCTCLKKKNTLVVYRLSSDCSNISFNFSLLQLHWKSQGPIKIQILTAWAHWVTRPPSLHRWKMAHYHTVHHPALWKIKKRERRDLRTPMISIILSFHTAWLHQREWKNCSTKRYKLLSKHWQPLVVEHFKITKCFVKKSPWNGNNFIYKCSAHNG